MVLDTDRGRYRGLILFIGSCYARGLVAFLSVRLIAANWRLKGKY